MKLRLDGKSLRLRLSEADLSQFAATGAVDETAYFPANNALKYALKISQSATEVTVKFADEQIVVKVPQKLASEWLESEMVGFDRQIDLEGGRTFKVLVEKDLGCSH